MSRTRLCQICKVAKPISEMTPRRDRSCGVENRCKPCNRARVAEWLEKNRERARERAREWRNKNLEYARKRDRDRAKDPKRALSKKEFARARHLRMRLEMLHAYGGRCACCGEMEPLFLTLEHINHDGGAHRRAKGPNQILSELKKLGWPKDKYTLLCMNCNWSERHGKKCPHKIKAEQIKNFIVVG